METAIYKYSYVQNHIKYFSSFNVWFKGNYWQLAGRDLVNGSHFSWPVNVKKDTVPEQLCWRGLLWIRLPAVLTFRTPGTKACGRMLSSNKSVLCVVHPHQDSWLSPSGDSWYRFQTSSGKPLNAYPSFTQNGDLGQSMKMGEFTNPIGDPWTGAFANLKSRTSIFRFSHLHRGWWTKERKESCSEMGSFISFVHCIFSISKRACLPVDAQETFVEWKNREFRNETDPWQVRRGKTVGQCNIEEKGPMLFLSLLPSGLWRRQPALELRRKWSETSSLGLLGKADKPCLEDEAHFTLCAETRCYFMRF